ncbi:hypothetical protein IWX76_000438 [Pedobacter sp. CAN_A7]|uniref:protease n=1 Tax=Pedobacter sp. CAN_A7 TaxID=2787722 RepID=UPI0018CA894E
MKNIHKLLFSSVVLLAACSNNLHTATQDDATSDSNQNAGAMVTEKVLTAKMTIAPVAMLSDSISFRFTVYNNTDSTRSFCKWHTPFERLMSKYLDVRDESGQEVDYKGAMAKRMMPPPADSFITVNKGDSISVVTDLKEGYAIQKPGKYSIKYNSSEINGLVVKDSISVTVK